MIVEALIHIRKYHDLNQKELAIRFGVCRTVISRIETREVAPSLKVIEKYSKAFDIPVSSILFFAESLPKAQKGGKVRLYLAKKVLDILGYITARAK